MFLKKTPTTIQQHSYFCYYLLEISFLIWFKAYEIKLYFNCSFYWKSDYNYNHSKSFEWIRIKDFTHFFYIYNGIVSTTCTSSNL